MLLFVKINSILDQLYIEKNKMPYFEIKTLYIHEYIYIYIDFREKII